MDDHLEERRQHLRRFPNAGPPGEAEPPVISPETKLALVVIVIGLTVAAYGLWGLLT